jgi:pyruvate ferredoxin oxidoreductase gamma subunit
VPGTELARKIVGRPVPNAALLGAFAAVSGVVSLDSVITAVLQRFTGTVAAANATAARTAYQVARIEIEELEHA